MATRDELLRLLDIASEEAPDGEPVPVLVADLEKLRAEDLPEDVELQPVDRIDDKGGLYVSFGATLMRGDKVPVVAYVAQEGVRKYWTAPLGVEEYHHLVREAVEARHRTRGDVELGDIDDQDVLFGVHFTIDIPQENLRQAYAHARLVQSELLEAAEAVTTGVQDQFDGTVKRLRGWGTAPLDQLVDRMREGTAHEKGLTLEELTSRLFARVPGFSAAGQVSTHTEQIDINIQNASEDELWRRESFLLLAECKNWAGVCGQNEFELFKGKLRKRTGRVSCGFLVSWNGFADTVTAEMLRGTEGSLLVVPITGADLRAAVREDDFPDRLKRLHQDAVFL